jgi:hypothetical protein
MFKNDHYNKYPNMKPWIGESYYSKEHKRLLVIGESHYLPDGSTKSLNVEGWYQSEQCTLSDDELPYISTSRIIENNLHDNFKNKAHGIYRNFSKVINAVSYNYSPPSEVMNHLSFMNFFQRPAEVNGGSIRVSKQDIEVSKLVLEDVIRELTPNLVIFTSSKAGEYGARLVRELDIPVVVTPHPNCQWWNRQAKSYGGYGREIIPKFLIKHDWYK